MAPAGGGSDHRSTLFDAPPPRTRSGPATPDTSHDAAASITDSLSAQRRSVFDAVCDVERHNCTGSGATAYEVQADAYTGHAPAAVVIAVGSPTSAILASSPTRGAPAGVVAGPATDLLDSGRPMTDSIRAHDPAARGPR